MGIEGVPALLGPPLLTRVKTHQVCMFAAVAETWGENGAPQRAGVLLSGRRAASRAEKLLRGGGREAGVEPRERSR